MEIQGTAEEKNFSYDDLTAFNDFINSVTISSYIGTSTIQLTDIGYFAPSLLVMDNLLRFSGEVTGRINNLKLKEILLEYGNSSIFEGKITMNGLPDIEETFMHLSVKDLNTNKSDLEQIVIGNDNGLVLY